MKKELFTSKGILLTLVLSLVCTTAMADIYMKQKHHRDGMKVMGRQQPDEDFVDEVWISDEGFRSDNPQQGSLMLFNEGKVIMLDHQKKTYTEMPMNMGEMMAGAMQGEDAEDMAAFQGMMKNMMKMEATVQPTNEKKKINNWNCQKYMMTLNTFGGAVTSEIWATEDLKIDKNLYNKFQTKEMMLPGMEQAVESMEQEMKKIKGVQVRNTSTSQMMNQTTKSTTELLEFKEGKAPEGIFGVPSGYTKVKGEDRGPF